MNNSTLPVITKERSFSASSIPYRSNDSNNNNNCNNNNNGNHDGHGKVVLGQSSSSIEDVFHAVPSTRPVPELEGDDVELWLDHHQDFLSSYLNRKASRTILEDLIKQNHILSLPQGDTPDCSPCGSSCSTPIQRFYHSDGERKSTGTLNKIVTTIDGQPTFINYRDRSRTMPTLRPPRKTRKELMLLNEKELLLELVKDIANDLDVTSLCHKILQNVSILVNADRCSLFLVRGRGSDRYLEAKVFDVNCDSRVDIFEKRTPIRVPWGSGIVGYAAKTGEVLNISDAYKVVLSVSIYSCLLLINGPFCVVSFSSSIHRFCMQEFY